ncbi:unnamed protein product, partial [Owenia fusiformis]
MGLKVTYVLCLTLLMLGIAKISLGKPIQEDKKNTTSELELKDEKVHELEHQIEEEKVKDLTEKIEEQKNKFKIISKLVEYEHEVIKLLEKDDIKKDIKTDQTIFKNEVEKIPVKEKAAEANVTDIPSKVDESLREEDNKASNEEINGSGEEGSGEEDSGVDGSGSSGIETELIGGEIIVTCSNESMTADIVNDKENPDVQSSNAPKDEGFMDYQEKGKVDGQTQKDDNELTNSESNEHKNLSSANGSEHVQNDVEVVVTEVNSATNEKVTMVDKDYSESNTEKNEPQSDKPGSEEKAQSEEDPQSEEPQRENEPQSEELQHEEEPQRENEPQIEKPQSENEPKNEEKPQSEEKP